MSTQQKCANGVNVKDVAEKIAELCNEPRTNWGSPGGLTAGGESMPNPNIEESIFGKSCGSLLQDKDASGNWIAKVPEASIAEACELYNTVGDSAHAQVHSTPVGASVVVNDSKKAATGTTYSTGNSRAENLNGAVIPRRKP